MNLQLIEDELEAVAGTDFFSVTAGTATILFETNSESAYSTPPAALIALVGFMLVGLLVTTYG